MTHQASVDDPPPSRRTPMSIWRRSRNESTIQRVKRRYDLRMSSGQSWDPDLYGRKARFVAELGLPLVELLAPRAGERILDLGCGDGALTEKLVALGCTVVAVDASAAQVAAARARGLDAQVANGEALTFDGEFDGVFSNAALHWMKRAEAVVDGVWRALRPDGRFVAELGGDGNVAAIRTACGEALRRRGIDPEAIDPWYFPTADAYGALLTARGFEVVSLDLFARPTPLDGDIADWLAVFAVAFTSAVPVEDRPALVAEVREAVRPRLQDERGVWTADYVRLRLAARRPG
jgi:SAM-dependent methyltransferase